MATPPQLTQLAFANGFDESIEDEILDSNRAFKLLENGRQELRGGYRTRRGFSALGSGVVTAWPSRATGSTRTTGNRVGTTGGRPYVIDGSELQTYDETSATWFSQGRVPEVAASVIPSSSAWTGNRVSTVADMVVCNGIRAIATTSFDPATGNYEARVGLETVDGLMLRTHESIFFPPSSSVPTLRLGTYGTTIVAIVGYVGSGGISAKYTSAASASAAATTGWTSITTSTTDRLSASGNARYQLVTQSLTDRVAFAYVNNSGGTSQVTVKTLSSAGILDSTTVSTASATPDVIGLEGSIADTLWVSWNQTTAVRLIGLTANNLAVVKATAFQLLTWTSATIPALTIVTQEIGIVSDPSVAGAGWMVSTENSLRATWVRRFKTVAGAVTFDSTGTQVFGVKLVSRPFAFGGRFYATVGPYTSNGVAAVADFTNLDPNGGVFRPVADVFPGLVQTIGSHPYVSTTTVDLTMGILRSSASPAPQTVRLDFASASRWDSVDDGGHAVIASGVLSYVDDATVSEVSFLHAPSPTAVVLSNAGSLTGTFSYVYTYEQVDGNGDWNVSSVSVPFSTGALTSKRVDLEVAPLAITNRQTTPKDESVRICVYRTDSTGVAPYYYVTDIVNDTSKMAAYTDNNADVVITQNRLLLGTGNLPGTNGAPQDRRSPGCLTRHVIYSGMIVGAFGSDLYYSGQKVTGEGRWFNPAFTQSIPDTITALAEVDGTLYVFAARALYAVTGDPPSDNGASGGLGPARGVASEVGSIDGHTLVTEQGVWFRSHRGIELLGRGGGVTWVGEGVQKTLATYPIVTSMVLDERNSLVRITLAAALSGGRASGEGRTVVYDTTLQTWVSRDDIRGVSAHEAAQDACVVTIGGEQRYAWLGTDGTVHYEKLDSDADAYLDGSTWITKTATTAQFKTSGIQGKQQINRLLVLERKTTSHDLSVALAYNHEQTFRTAATYTAATINALLTAGYPITQLRHDPHDDAECEAVAVQLTEATPTSGTVGSGAGATWLALTLDITPKPGVFEVPEGAG